MKTLKELKKIFVRNITDELNDYLVDIKKLDKEEIINKSFEISTTLELYKFFKNQNNYSRLELNVLSNFVYPLKVFRESIKDYNSITEVSLYELMKNCLLNEMYKYVADGMEEIHNKPNYNLICDVSTVLRELDKYEMCDELKEKFEIDDIYDMGRYHRIVVVNEIFDSPEDIKYLNNFFTKLVNDVKFQSVKINNISDKINEKMIQKVIPELRKLENKISIKTKNNHER